MSAVTLSSAAGTSVSSLTGKLVHIDAENFSANFNRRPFLIKHSLVDHDSLPRGGRRTGSRIGNLRSPVRCDHDTMWAFPGPGRSVSYQANVAPRKGPSKSSESNPAPGLKR